MNATDITAIQKGPLPPAHLRALTSLLPARAPSRHHARQAHVSDWSESSQCHEPEQLAKSSKSPDPSHWTGETECD